MPGSRRRALFDLWVSGYSERLRPALVLAIQAASATVAPLEPTAEELDQPRPLLAALSPLSSLPWFRDPNRIDDDEP